MFLSVYVFPGNRTHNLLGFWRNAQPLSHTGTLWLPALLNSFPHWCSCLSFNQSGTSLFSSHSGWGWTADTWIMWSHIIIVISPQCFYDTDWGGCSIWFFHLLKLRCLSAVLSCGLWVGLYNAAATGKGLWKIISQKPLTLSSFCPSGPRSAQDKTKLNSIMKFTYVLNQ